MQEVSSDSTTSTTISIDDTKKHFVRNITASVIFFVFSAATSLYMVPFQIHHLGTANFGMVTLAISFAAYLQILTVALVSSIGRFVAVEMARSNYDRARSYLNTQTIALFLSLIHI